MSRGIKEGRLGGSFLVLHHIGSFPKIQKGKLLGPAIWPERGLSLGSRPTEGQALILKFNLVSQDLGPGNSYISC